jgi:hypothetical protein
MVGYAEHRGPLSDRLHRAVPAIIPRKLFNTVILKAGRNACQTDRSPLFFPGDKTIRGVEWFPDRLDSARMNSGRLNMRFDPAKTRTNVASATTEDLLDRATIWREGMEPEALDLIDAELRKRGVTLADLEAHASQRSTETIGGPDGTAAICYRCAKPAIEQCWVWGKLWYVLPLFPRRAYVCEDHRPGAAMPSRADRHPPA